MKSLLQIGFFVFLMIGHAQIPESTDTLKSEIRHSLVPDYSPPEFVIINRPVRIKEYFQYLDSLVTRYDTLVTYPLSEHLLVRANPWIIDTLANTDYYRMMERDSFVYDQKELIVLKKGDSLFFPKKEHAVILLNEFKKHWIDINIPEYRMRIYRDSSEVYNFPIRVGQNRKKYLAMNDRVTDLRTKKGIGSIIRHERDPVFYNPTNGRRFYYTRRDDDSTTVMPRIPWIETEINGVRNGQMIHPTTNPKTLGKAYSNGCIGTTEGDAWIIYYYAPLRTVIRIRYELSVTDEAGEEVILKNIYQWKLE